MMEAMERMEYICLKETDSTNSYCKRHAAEISAPAVVSCESQTAGRGQRGNCWEATPGENLTFSIVWEGEGVAPAAQFVISEATALGVAAYLKGRGIEAKVKWPNDIYVGDRKICGILIEHTIEGMTLQRSVIGAGINVNQREFRSDAPNPVSMTQITGMVYDLDEELRGVVNEITSLLSLTATADGREWLHDRFLSSLWRGDGLGWPFRDRDSGKEFEATIEDVEPTGWLHLRLTDSGERRRYAFKEVEFLLKGE